VTAVWYRVRDLDAGRAFFRDVLGFEEVFVDFGDGWSAPARPDGDRARGG
jgi:catechol 2,3-dioxygenase-like lactoylglutathione lyase family enzyme